MSIYVLGLNHKTATVALREKVYFSEDKLALYLQDLLARSLCSEAVLFSTCNRSELYCETDDISAVRDWFCAQTSLLKSEVASALYLYRDEEAVSHMMAVACGLDSMILGEPQILGQMKEAFSEGCAANAVGAKFHRLFQQVFLVAKEIRSVTAIGACPVSVASAAVQFAKQHQADFANANVVLIGAGDTTELMCRYLKGHLQQPITLVNRTLEKASSLMMTFAGEVLPFDRMREAIARADIVFSATGSPVPVVSAAMVSEVMQTRLTPLLMIDIAVPRDIEEAVGLIPHVTLHSIDDLKMIIEHNRQGRAHAAVKAEEMIREKSHEFIKQSASFDKVAHTIRAYRGQIEEICRIELHRARQRLREGANPDDVLDAFAYAFTKKLLHAPSVQLRQAGAEGRFELLRFAKELFAIKDPEVELI